MPHVRFLPLASGSKGNCYYVETPHTRLLIDCGISYKRLAATLLEYGISPASLDAICITHLHSDHVGGLGSLLGRHRLRVYLHQRAWLPLDLELRRQGLDGGLETCDALAFEGDGFPHRDLDLLPVPVSHDSHPTVMFKVFAPGGLRLGILTDLGVYESVHSSLFGDCDLLVLESNHCPELLRSGPYPARLKARIAGSRGHLSNYQALEFALGLRRLPRELILGHLSDTNNTADTASSVFTAAVSATTLPSQRTEVAHATGLFSPAELRSTQTTTITSAAQPDPGSGIPHRVLVQMTAGPLFEL
jgi:phosphoribosyl 1,2-cyclic phosphodiesterase